nr:hypothetical protein [Microbispora cellulosiformans]
MLTRPPTALTTPGEIDLTEVHRRVLPAWRPVMGSWVLIPVDDLGR